MVFINVLYRRGAAAVTGYQSIRIWPNVNVKAGVLDCCTKCAAVWQSTDVDLRPPSPRSRPQSADFELFQNCGSALTRVVLLLLIAVAGLSASGLQ